MQKSIGSHVLLADREFGPHFRCAHLRDEDAEKTRQFADTDFIKILESDHFSPMLRASAAARDPSQRIPPFYPSMSDNPSKKTTTPVSKEFSAPTTMSPAFWMSCSMTSEPCRKCCTDARIFARTAA